MTPILPVSETSIAACVPGAITPMIGTETFSDSSSSAAAAAVLHATTRSLTSCSLTSNQ